MLMLVTVKVPSAHACTIYRPICHATLLVQGRPHNIFDIFVTLYGRDKAVRVVMYSLQLSLSLSLFPSLSLSLSHTHTHTLSLPHSLSLFLTSQEFVDLFWYLRSNVCVCTISECVYVHAMNNRPNHVTLLFTNFSFLANVHFASSFG